jgi:hypothetical protein
MPFVLERTRQPLLAGIEELIDQVSSIRMFLVSMNEMKRSENSCSEWRTNHLGFFDDQRRGRRDGGRRPDPSRLAGQASLAKEIPWSQSAGK